MSRAVMQQALDALGLAHDMAAAEAVELRRSLGEQLPHKHKAAADDLAKIDAAATALRAALSAPVAEPTYTSTQATNCACCGKHKHTPLRIDAMGGYVCLTCIDQKLGSLLGEFGYADPQPTPVAQPLTDEQIEVVAAATFLAVQDVPDEHVNGKTWDLMFAQAIERAHKIGGPA